MKIRNLINAQVIKSYDLKDQGSDYFRSDAGLAKSQVHEMLTNLFYAKAAVECAQMIYETTQPDIWGNTDITDQPDLNTVTHEEAILWIHDRFGGDDINDLTEFAMTYRCYEPWETIVSEALGMDKMLATEEQYAKLVSYLYDEYAPESECA